MKALSASLLMFWLVGSALAAVEAPDDDPLIFDKRSSQWKKLLTDESPIVRYRAARDLGRIGPRAVAARPDLLAALKDENRSVRSHAARAIRQIGAQVSDVPALTEALGDEDSDVRKAAAYALGDMGPKAASALPALKKLRGVPYSYAIVQICPNDKSGVPYLIERANSQDANGYWRDRAMLALGRIGPRAKEALPSLNTALEDERNHDFQRMHAAYAIAGIDPDDETAIRFLLDLSKKYKSGASGSAVYLLGQIRPPRMAVVPTMIQELTAHQEHFFHAHSLVKALGNLGPDASAALPTLRSLATTHSNEIIRNKSALAVYKIEQP